MARALRRTVVSGGVSYPAGTTATAELSKLITNPRAWDGEDDAQAPAPTPSQQQSEAQEPPRGGAGSGESAWRAYAAHLGIDIPEDADRGDIIALVDAHGSED